MIRKLSLFFFLVISISVFSQTNVSITTSKTTIAEDESLDIIATLDAAIAEDVIINFELTGTAKNDLDFTMAFLTRGDPSTVAGGNGQGSAPNQLDYPSDISVDADGNMYIFNDYYLKKWVLGADTGVIFESPDLSSARFCVDALGNIYLSDATSSQIKKWELGATALITVAGGNDAGSATNQLNNPAGIYVDEDENIYIADRYNQRIQKWAKGATEGVTVAGGNGLGSAANQLNLPLDVSVNSDGDIFVLDGNNYRIQKWSPGAETGITIVNYTYPSQYFYIDNAGSIYVSHGAQHMVEKCSSEGGEWTMVAGSSDGPEDVQLNNPQGITADNDGNLYVADCNYHRIQRVQYAPQITVKAGETEGKISIAGIDDQANEFDETIIFTPTDASNCILSSTDPFSVTITDNDEQPSVVFSFSEEKIKENSSTDVSLIAIPSKVSGKDIEITFTLEGDALETEEYVLSSKNITILAGDTAGRLNISTNGLDDDLVEVLKTITFRVNSVSNAIVEYDTVSLYYESDDDPGFTIAVSKTSIAEHESLDIVATLETATSKDAIIDFDLTGTAKHNIDYTTAFLSRGIAKTVAGGNGFGSAANQLNGPDDIAIDADGNMYILDHDEVKKWVLGADEGIVVADVNTTVARLFVDISGNIYLSDRYNHRVQKWAVGATDWETVAGGNDAGSDANQLDNPQGIYVDKDENIYIADRINHRIQKWAEGATEGITVAGGNGQGTAADQLNSPMDVSINSDGDICVLDAYRIQKWSPGAEAGSTVVSLSNYFYYFFVDVFGDIFVTDRSNSSVLKWNSVRNQWTTVAGGNGLGAEANQLDSPGGIAIDNDGNLFVADYNNHRIQRLQYAPQITVKAGETEGKLTISGIEDDLNEEGDESIIVKTRSAENAEFGAVEDISIILLDNTKALTLQENPFIGLRNGAVSWGDYDRDGDMDVAVMGLSPLAGAITAVYENQEGSFVNTDQAFTRLYEGDISWVDINKDGWIDLVVSGYGDAPTTKLYLNNEGVLEDTDDYGLPQLYTSKMAWGDLDNDGDIDLAISGIDADEKYVFYIYYREDNQANFIQETAMNSSTWPGFINGDLKIVDIDLDGDNDIVFSGQNADGNAIGGIRYNSYIESEIYSENNLNTALKNSTLEIVKLKNTPTDGLSAITSGIDSQGNIVLSTTNFAGSTDLFPKLKNGDISFADFDNDGLNDAVFTGEDEVGVPITKLFLQSADGSFRASDIQLQGLRNSTANWVDYDMDGDLDLFLTGLDDTGAKTLLYEAETVNKVNSPPAVITGLNLEDLGNGNVRLSWDKPDDDFSTDLGYVLRLGTSSGGTELSNTESDLATGRRLISKAAPIYTNFFETQLDPGKYYWSVQAVDQGLKGASFSEESTFVLTYEWKILNQGGIIDRKINAVKDPVIKLADIDNDDDMDLIYGSASSGSSQLLKYDGKRLINSDNNPFYLYRITAVEVGDINGDGITDVLFNNMANDNTFDLQIYISNAANFTKYSLGDGLYKANGRIVDLNNDGQAEVVLIGLSNNQVSGKIKFYIYEYDNTSVTPSFIKTDVSDQIASLSAASFDLGDIDNDQDIDLIMSGFSATLGLQSFIYENTTVMGETYQFVAMDNNLLATIDGTNDLIDFDGDGDLDAVITGTSLSGDVFDIFENQINEGINVWSKLENTGLAPMRLGKIDLGDFNGDGYSDLLYSGTVSGLGKVTNLTEFNPTDNTFLDSSFDVSDIIDAAVEFGDLEGDGDLDFAVSGESSTVAGTYVFRAYVNVRNQSAEVLANGADKSSEFQNEYEDLLDLFTKNNPPSTPVSTSVNILTDLPVTEDGYPVEFSWLPSSDDHTPTGGITYSFKVGKTAGGEEIMSSNSNSNGTRKSATKGNAEHNTSWRLRLLEGTYYWSVQAIDASFTGSEFSPSTEFVISSALAVDNIDLAEELYCYPNPTKGSLNLQIPGTDAQAHLVVRNLVGAIVYQENIAIASDRNVKVDISSLPAAMYMLSVETSNSNKVVKITKE